MHSYSLASALFTRKPSPITWRGQQAVPRRSKRAATPGLEDLENRDLLTIYTAINGTQLYADLALVNKGHQTSDTIWLAAPSITMTQGQATVDPTGSLLIESTEGNSSSATVVNGGGFYVEGGGSTTFEYLTVTGGYGEDFYLYGSSTQSTSLTLNDVEVTGCNDGAVTTRYTNLSATNSTEFVGCNSYGLISQGNVSMPGTGPAVQFVSNYTGWAALSDNFGSMISATDVTFFSNQVFGFSLSDGSATLNNATFVGAGVRNISDYGSDTVNLNNVNISGVTGQFGAIQTSQDSTSTFTVNGGSLVSNSNSSGAIISTNGGTVNLLNLNFTTNTAPEMVSLGGVGNDTLTSVFITHNTGAGVVVTSAATEDFFGEDVIQNCSSASGVGAALTLNGSNAFIVGGSYDYNTGGAIYDSGSDPDLTLLGPDISHNTGGSQGALAINVTSGGYGGSINAENVPFIADQGTGSVSAVSLTGPGSLSSFVVQAGFFLNDTGGYAISVALVSMDQEVAVAQNLFQGSAGAVTVAGITGQLFGPLPQFVFGSNEVTGGSNPVGQVDVSGGIGSFVIADNYIHGNSGSGVAITGNSTYTTGNPGASVLVVGNTISGNTAAVNGGGVDATIGQYDSQNFANNTIYLNTAVKGGGIYDQGLVPSGQGNIEALPGVNLIGNTITENTASGAGGGVWFATATGWPFGPPPPAMVGAPGALSLDNSIIAQNNGPTSSPDIAGPVFEAVYSLVGNDTGATFSNSTSTDILGTSGSPVNAGLYGPVVLPGGPGVSGSGSVGPVFKPGSISVGTGDANDNSNPYGFQTSTDELGFNRSSYSPTQGAEVGVVAPKKLPQPPPPTTKPVNPVNPASALLVTVSSPPPLSSPAMGGVLLTTGSAPTVKLIGLTKQPVVYQDGGSRHQERRRPNRTDFLPTGARRQPAPPLHRQAHFLSLRKIRALPTPSSTV